MALPLFIAIADFVQDLEDEGCIIRMYRKEHPSFFSNNFNNSLTI